MTPFVIPMEFIMKRVILFLATNLAVLLVLGLAANLLGVDRFLDMCRTTVNVSGDLVIAALVDPKKETR